MALQFVKMRYVLGRFIRSKEDFVKEMTFIRLDASYAPVQRVFATVEYGSEKNFHNSFVSFSAGRGTLKRLCVALVLHLLLVGIEGRERHDEYVFIKYM